MQTQTQAQANEKFSISCVGVLRLRLRRGSSHVQSGFQMTVEKPKPKQVLRPRTTGATSAMNQSQFLAITFKSLKAREK